jgi:hypothetical protein
MASHRGAAPHHSLTQLSTAAAAEANSETEPVNTASDLPSATSQLTSAPYSAAAKIAGFSSSACLSRAALWQGLQPGQLLCASGDESTSQLLVWDCSGSAGSSSGDATEAVLLHRCERHTSPVLDVQALTVGGKQLVASVSKRDVRVLQLP